MELNFLGRGNSSNYREGNNAAFFREDDNLFLIDCGEDVFLKLLGNNILDNINKVHVMITHTHSDHVGSLGSLIMYCYFNRKIDLNLVLADYTLHNKDIIKILECMGCSKEMYQVVDQANYDNQYNIFQSIRYLEVEHVDYLHCYGLLFKTSKGIIYYSGDSRNFDKIDDLLKTNEVIDKLYIDVTSSNFPDNIHLFVGELANKIPPEMVSRVYCMHFNDQKCMDEAEKYGFQIVKKI